MSGYGRYYRPALKSSVDVQLQTAFNEGLWSTVVRLAAQRFKTKKDPYYDTVRVCAEAQMDTAPEKAGVVLAVDALVRDKTAVPDIDSIELYEWAMQDAGFPYDFSQTIGTLRARWVKANPSSPAVLDCLEACVLAWDLVNAQQIAAALDKAQPGKHEGKTMFWNITLTHLLSTSPQCPENMVAMFEKLSRMQLEKAAAVTATASEGKAAPRSLRAEEEINLYYRVVGKDAYSKSISDDSSAISIPKQLDQGRKYLLLESLRAFEASGDWESIYKLCERALSKEDENGSPSFVAFDMRIWKLFIKAATMRPDVEGALADATTILEKFISIKTSVAPMYKKNISLATLELAFHNPSSLLAGVTDPDKASSRVITLFLVLEQSLFQRSAFDDVKGYVSQLTFKEAKYFVDHFSKILLGKEPNKQRRIIIRALETKFRYLLTTCPFMLEHVVLVGEAAEPRFKCLLCGSTTDKNCKTCLDSVASTALSAYKEAEESSDDLKGLDKDPRIDLALIAASAFIKLSGLRQMLTSSRLPTLGHADMSRLLQATSLISTQVTKTPSDIPLRLLLVQLYLLLGCGSLAYQAWTPLEVKRTIQDALSPLFFDRISTISPGLFQQRRQPLMEPLTSYYTGCLREDSPVKIWDAFKAGSYISILDMAAYSDQLRRSCTLAMTVVEERRATRALGGRIEGGIDQSPLLAHITEDTTFVQNIDHGSFPSLESAHVAPLHELPRFGPELSSDRCRLSLLAEQLHDAVSSKPPKEFKPTRPNDIAPKDRATHAEIFARLHSSLAELLLRRRPDNQSQSQSQLTSAEQKYLTILSLLAAILQSALDHPKSDSAPPPGLSTAISGLRASLTALRTEALSTPPDGPALLHRLSGHRAHALSLLRDATIAIRQGAALLTALHASEQARDRSGRSGLHKNAVAEAKALETLAAGTLSEARDEVKALKEEFASGGWLDRVEEWMFPVDGGLGDKVRDVIGGAELEEWTGKVVESWTEGVKGFTAVRWE